MGIVIFVAGCIVSYYALTTPLTRSVIAGGVTIKTTYVSTALFMISALLLIFAGTIISVKNEARAHYNRESFLGKFGIGRRK